MRKYQPIWKAIKKDKNHTVSLAAPIAIHKRIIQAVRKEKSGDTVFHLINSDNKVRYKLIETVEGKLITFKLVDISPIGINSL